MSTKETEPQKTTEKYYEMIFEQQWGNTSQWDKDLMKEMLEGGRLRYAQLGKNK